MSEKINQIKNEMAAVLSTASDEQLVQMVAVLANSSVREAKRALFAAYDECERRRPEMVPMLEQWVSDDSDVRPYWQMVIELMERAA